MLYYLYSLFKPGYMYHDQPTFVILPYERRHLAMQWHYFEIITQPFKIDENLYLAHTIYVQYKVKCICCK